MSVRSLVVIALAVSPGSVLPAQEVRGARPPARAGAGPHALSPAHGRFTNAYRPSAETLAGAMGDAEDARSTAGDGFVFPGGPGPGGGPGDPIDPDSAGGSSGLGGDVQGSENPPWDGAPPFQGWWGGGRFPVQIPIYAPLYGVTPGYFPTRVPKPSTATVTVHSGPARTKFNARSRFPEAVEAAVERLHEHALAGDPMKLGVERFRARDYHAAAEAFRRAAPLDPDNGLPRFGHSFAQFALGDYEGAAWSLRRGLDLLPDWASSGQDLGAWYETPIDLEDHLQALRSHCRLRPDDHEAKALLGYIAFVTGDTGLARASFQDVQTARADDPLPAHFLAELARIGDG